MTDRQIQIAIYDAIREVAKTDDPVRFAEHNRTCYEVAKRAVRNVLVVEAVADTSHASSKEDVANRIANWIMSNEELFAQGDPKDVLAAINALL